MILVEALKELSMYGIVNEISKPHTLNNRGGNYNGNQEYHLSNGKVDVLVIYIHIKPILL